MGNCLFLRKGETHSTPLSGILLSQLAEGSIVKINESGSPVEFYVAKHDYESGLNGMGRTLLVRKNIYDKRKWNDTADNTYASSSIDTWLNEDYKNLLDENIRTAIGTTNFYYTKSGSNTSVSNLERSVFLLSLTEFGGTDSSANTEGSTVSIAETLKIAKNADGGTFIQWTRTPVKSKTTVFKLNADGSIGAASPSISTSYLIPYSRPSFTLPFRAVFDKDTLVFKGVK